MINGTSPSQGVHSALARLDQDIAEAEERLNNLRAMRQNVEQFYDEYGEAPGSTNGAGNAAPSTTPESLLDHIAVVFDQNPREDFNTDQVLQKLSDGGVEAERESVRTTLYYLARKDRLSKVGRGRFALRR